MKVVFVNATGQLGGAERSLLDLIAAILGQDSPQQHTAALILGGDGPCVAAAESLGIPVEVAPLPPALAEWGDSGSTGGPLRQAAGLLWKGATLGPATVHYARSLRRRIAQFQPDVVHSNSIKTHLLTGLVRYPCPLVWHIRDYLGARPLVGRLSRWTSGRVRAAVTVSQSVALDAGQVFPEVAIYPIYDSIDTDSFSPGPRPGQIDDLARWAPPPPGTLRIGLVAAYAHWKGQLIFLEAAQKLLAKLPSAPVRFYIIGGPIYATSGSQFTRLELQYRAAELNLAQHVGFVPFQTNIAAIYRDLDVAVHASTKPEPFGRTIVEAQASGLPVIAAATGGAAELFTPEVNALGVPPGDAAALAAAMERLVQDRDLAARLGQAGRASAVERFSRPRLGREMTALYERLLAPQNR